MTIRPLGRQCSALVAIAAICGSISSVMALCSPPSQLRTSIQQQRVVTSPHFLSPFNTNTYHHASSEKSSLISLLGTTTDDMNGKAPLSNRRPRALGTVQVPTLVGCVTAAMIIRRVLTTTSNRLFQQHVIGAVLGSLVFLPAAVGSVQSRVDTVQAMKQDSATTRRGALIQHITAHLYITYGAALSAVVSLGSIFYNKMVLGKPHFASLHSRLALFTMTLWASAYLVAQRKVWTPMIKKRKFMPPQLLWASKWHRQLGKAASISMLVTTATGLSAWGGTTFGPTTLTLIVGVILSMAVALVLPPRR